MTKILILDDNELDAELLRLEVQQLEGDVETLVCRSGKEFQQKLKEFVPDIVLSDYNLPRYDGSKAIEFLQQFNAIVPIIIVTGFLPPTEAVRLIKQGAEDFILKEDLTTLVPAVVRALRNAEVKVEAKKQYELLQTISKISRTGGWRLDRDPECLYWSDVICDIFEVPHGYTPPLEEAMTFFKEGWSRDLIIKRVEETYETGKGYDEEVQIVTAKGNVRWIRTIGNLLIEDDEVTGVFGIAHDITEEREQEEEKRKQHHLLHAISTVSGTGGWRLNADRTELEWSSITRQIFGVAPDYIPDLKDAIEFYKEGWSRDLITQCVDRALIKGEGYKADFLTVNAKGEERWIRSLGQPEYEDGKITGIFGTIEDITEERYKREQRLKVANRHRNVLEATNAGTIDWDIVNNEIVIDENVAAIGGYNIEEIASLNANGEWYASGHDMQRFFSVEDEERVLEAVQEHLVGKTNKIEVEFRGIAKDAGKELWILIKGSITQRDEDGTAVQGYATIIDITEAKKIEQDNQAKTAQLANITKNIPGMVAKHEFTEDGELKLTYVSEYAREIYGIAPEKILDNPFLLAELVHPDDRNELYDTIQQAVLKHQGYSLLFRAQLPDGTKWLQTHAEPQLSESGIVAFDSVTLDLTEEFQTREELEKLSLVAEKATNQIMITDRAANVQWCNKSQLKQIGYTLEEVQAKSATEFIDPNSSPSVLADVQNTIEKGIELRTEFRAVRKDGSMYWAETTVTPVRNEEGKLVNFIVVSNDISERKENQRELVAALHELEQEKYALDQHSIVTVTDVDGTIKYVNSQFVALTGYTEEELIGNNPRIVNSGYHTKTFFGELYRTIGRGKVWQGLIRNKGKNGNIFWQRTTITPFTDPDTKKPVKYISISTDVTARVEAEKKLQNTLENLEEMVQERTIDLETAHQGLVDSVNYAQRLQQAVLPGAAALERAFENAFVILRPKDIVSGDFYWFHQHQHEVVVAVVDCTGHGVPGAMMSMLANELLENIVVDKGLDRPDVILEEVDTSLSGILSNAQQELTVSDGMDMSVITVDYRSNLFSYGGARSYGIFYRKSKGEFVSLKPDKYSIGGMFYDKVKDFSRTRFEFEKGDRVFLFSDGYYDQFGGKEGKKFLRRRFNKLIEETSVLTIQQQHQMLEKTLHDWMGVDPQVDDITVVGIEL